jgi:hypothetical protein
MHILDGCVNRIRQFLGRAKGLLAGFTNTAAMVAESQGKQTPPFEKGRLGGISGKPFLKR